MLYLCQGTGRMQQIGWVWVPNAYVEHRREHKGKLGSCNLRWLGNPPDFQKEISTATKPGAGFNFSLNFHPSLKIPVFDLWFFLEHCGKSWPHISSSFFCTSGSLRYRCLAAFQLGSDKTSSGIDTTLTTVHTFCWNPGFPPKRSLKQKTWFVCV